MTQKQINVQTNGEMVTDQEPVKKVKLHATMTKQEIEALIKKKREEKAQEP